MPPALSDEENGASSDEEEIPNHPAKAASDVDEDGEDADQYVVEKILSHRVDKPTGIIMYEVKWQGYEKKTDRTWEPEDNLETASEALQEYWDEIGGRPEPGETKGTKRKGRKSALESESTTPAPSTKRVKKEWSPPPGTWEHEVDYVDTVEEGPDPKTGNMTRYAYLVWTNKKKTQHPLAHVYHKCPQKMLIYYESHLVFTHTGDDEVNGKDTVMKGEY